MELTQQQIKKGIVLSVTGSVIAIILVMLLTQEDFSYRIFTRIDTTYLLLASNITISFWLLKALKLKVLAGGLGVNVSFKRVFAIYIASSFVAHVTPSSSGGLPFVIYFLHKEGLPLGKSTALTVLDNMFTLAFFITVAPLLLLVWGNYLYLGPAITRLFYLALFLVIVFIIFSIMLVFNTVMARTFFNWLLGLVLIRKAFTEEKLNRARKFIVEELDAFNQGIRILIKDKKKIFLVIVYTIAYWVLYLSLAPVLLVGLGVSISIPPVMLAQIVFNFIQPIIPTPGGSGGAELGFAYLFKFMIPDHLLGVFVATWRFFMFYASLIVGGIYFIYLVRGTNYLETKK